MKAVLIALGIASLAILAAIAWAIARFLKPRLGPSAYAIAGLVFLSPVVWVCILQGRPNTGQPKVLGPAELSRGAWLSIRGLAFFDGKLYLGTTASLVELRDGRVAGLLQFQDHTGVSGPWPDPANHLLWAADIFTSNDHSSDITPELLRFDGKQWARMSPPEGSCCGAGFQPIGDAQGFWLASGRTAWRLEVPSMKWRVVKAPSPPPAGRRGFNEVFGVLPIDRTPLLIIRHQYNGYYFRPGAAFVSDEIAADAAVDAPVIARTSGPFLAGAWAVTSDAGYVCTIDQALLQVTSQAVKVLPAPGRCEALAGGVDTDLLVSIKGKGVSRYSSKNGWTQIANSPCPNETGEYRAYLAASNGQVAFAIDRESRLSAGGIPNSELWILRGRDFVPVHLR